MKTILVPVDFSEATGSVVSAAAALARAHCGRIVLLNAVRPPIVVNEYAPELEKLALLAEKSAAEKLALIEEDLRSQGIVVSSVELCGHPVPTIVSEAARLPADYIVIGSHGHTALYNLLVGSTASGVLHHAFCPVLVVPSIHRRGVQEMRRVGQKVASEPAGVEHY